MNRNEFWTKTQEIIKSRGHEVEIINYRMPSQKNFYSIFPRHLGKRAFVRSIFSCLDISKSIAL